MAKELIAVALLVPGNLREEFARFLACALGTLESPDTADADKLTDYLDKWLEEEQSLLKRGK